jgi:TetR/AcrR family transcriptional regulator, fatty acid metabolism regulator protein
MGAETLHQSLKERQRKERGELILRAAEAEFTEKGYRDTSMDEIAARVGIAKGTVYLYFPSKQDLVFALIEREFKMFLEKFEHISASPLTARAKLEHLFLLACQEILGKRLQALISFFTSADVRKDVYGKGKQIQLYSTELATRLSTLIEEGKAAGELDPSIPTIVMLSSFFTLLSPHAFRRVLDAGQVSPDELPTHLARIYFQGIATPQ